MLEDSYSEVFQKTQMQFFRQIFELVREREGSLSAMEAFSVVIIDMLQEPTIGQFADFLNISQSNATYKVNSLIKKGYLERQNSDTDRREYHLILSQKYHSYISLLTAYQNTVIKRIRQRFTPEEVQLFDRMLRTISGELMPECGRDESREENRSSQ